MSNPINRTHYRHFPCQWFSSVMNLKSTVQALTLQPINRAVTKLIVEFSTSGATVRRRHQRRFSCISEHRPWTSKTATHIVRFNGQSRVSRLNLTLTALTLSTCCGKFTCPRLQVNNTRGRDQKQPTNMYRIHWELVLTEYKKVIVHS